MYSSFLQDNNNGIPGVYNIITYSHEYTKKKHIYMCVMGSGGRTEVWYTIDNDANDINNNNNK